MNINVMLKYNFDDHTLEGFVNSCVRGFKVKQITDDLLRVDLYTFDRQRDTFWDGADPIHSFLLEIPAGECIEEQFWAIFRIVEDYRGLMKWMESIIAKFKEEKQDDFSRSEREIRR